MDNAATRRLRLRHAFRCAIGGATIASIGLATHITQGCAPSVLFFISTVAGTAQNYQGFQLRSTSLTFVGAVVGALFYLVVSVIASQSTVATFFLSIPFIAFLSALRADKKLMPMPAVANVFMGLLIISRFGETRNGHLRALGIFLIEAVLAWSVAIAVNLVYPDRGGDLGRHIMALELRKLGARISAVGTKTFSKPSLAGRRARLPSDADSERSQPSIHHFSLIIDDSGEEGSLRAGLLEDDYMFLTSNLPPSLLRRDDKFLHREELVDAAERSLNIIHDLRPFGRTSVRNHAALAHACQLFEASKYEPRILPESLSRWRNVAEWNNVIANMRALINKVSSLESIVGMRPESPARFSEELITRFFGEAFVPLWVSHYASCAAACSKMAALMCNATCKDMFQLPEVASDSEESFRSLQGLDDLDRTIDPRKWKSRRSEMYMGFLLRYRLGLLEYGRENLPEPGNQITEAPSSKSQSKENVKPPSSTDSEPVHCIRHSTTVDNFKTLCKENSSVLVDPVSVDAREYRTRVFERQALSYFAVTSHAMSEEIGHVQESMTTLAKSSDARGAFAPFYFLFSGYRELGQRIKSIFSRNLSAWEVRFILTHTMLLSSILGLALFLPLRERFEASELAWVFTSAALAAQLSAEPTLFIGTIRVVATISGTASAFAFSSILDAMGRSSRPALMFLTVPYLVITTILCLMILQSFRYAAFLFVVTNNVMLFCSRSSPSCLNLFEARDPECFPTWSYAVSRSANVSIGVLFAVFFHLMFWPRFANQVALLDLSQALLNASRLYGKLHRTYFSYGIGSKDKISFDLRNKQGKENNRENAIKSLYFENEAFVKEVTMVEEVQSKVGEPLASAMLVANSEADVWRRGPFRLYPLIPRVLANFVALNVSLGEMAAVLGRRPIFAPAYGRSVFEHYILPMIERYETLQISLNNLTATACRAVTETQIDEIKKEIFDLHQAIRHLAQTRGRLREDAEQRAIEFKKLSAMALMRKGKSRGRDMKKPGLGALLDTAADGLQRKPARQPKRMLSRSCSEGNLASGSQGRDVSKLCVDDVVLYNAFTFITDGCLSAFVRIADTVVAQLEIQVKELSEKKKRKAMRKKRRWFARVAAQLATILRQVRAVLTGDSRHKPDI